jgi:hypothetical protein
MRFDTTLVNIITNEGAKAFEGLNCEVNLVGKFYIFHQCIKSIFCEIFRESFENFGKKSGGRNRTPSTFQNISTV